MRLPVFIPPPRLREALALSVVIAMALLLGWRHLFDADIFYHIANGREILGGGRMPASNTLVWPASERPFYPNPAWLFAVLLALVEGLAGLTGIVLVKTAVVLALYLVLYRLCRRAGAGVLLAPALLFIFGMGAAFRLSERPHLFSLLFFALCLLLLVEGRRKGRWLWLLPPLFALWANIHSGYVLGLILLGAVLCGELLPSGWRQRAPQVKRLAAVFLFCVLATFAAPHPLTNLLFLAQLLEPRSYPITEYFSPTLSAHPWFFGTALLLALWSAWRRLSPRQWSWLLPTLIFLPLALYSARFVPFFLMTALPWIIRSVGEWSTAGGLRRMALPGWVRGPGSVLLLLALPSAIYLWPPVPLGFGPGVEPSVAPMGSVRFLEEVRAAGRLYNSQSLGGLGAMFLALHYRMYQTAYFQVEKDAIEDAYRASQTPETWSDFLDRHAVEVVWLDVTREPVSLDYYPAEAWALVYHDDFSAVLLRRQGLNPAVVAAHEYRVANPLLLAALESETLTDPFVTAVGLKEARRALASTSDNRLAWSLLALLLAQQPGEEGAALTALNVLESRYSAGPEVHFEKGRIFSRLGRHADGEQALLRYMALVPDDPAGYLELGNLLNAAGNSGRARQVLQQATEKFPETGHAHLLLGSLRLNEGELKGAWASLSRARELLESAEVYNLLGIVKAQQGDVAGALSYFRNALALDPDFDPAQRNLHRALEEVGYRQ